MRSFEYFKSDGRIREITPKKSMAESLLKRAEDRLKSEKDRELDEENSFLALENIYEALREVLEADMAAEGYSSSDHVATLSYAEEKLGIEEKELNKLHRFRKLRNKSRYEAEEITMKEAKQIIEFAEDFVPAIQEEVEKKL